MQKHRSSSNSPGAALTAFFSFIQGILHLQALPRELRPALSLFVFAISIGTASANDQVPLRTLLNDEGEIIEFGRDLILGRLEIRIGGESIPLSHEDRTNLYFHDAFVFNGEIFIFVYDVTKNSPSGRRLSGLVIESEILKFSTFQDGYELTHVASLPVGLDLNTYSAIQPEKYLLCTQSACAQFTKNLSGGIDVNVILSVGRSIIELATDGDFVFALLQLDYNDEIMETQAADVSIFFICQIAKNIDQCEAVAPDIIPYRLQVIDGKASFDVFSDADSAADLFLFDLNRLRGGTRTLSENNLEGRIAWSTVYFANGIISALTDMTNTWVNHSLINPLRNRLETELTSMLTIGQTSYPGYFSKRYSMDREPVLFLLHLGRIARTFSRAYELFPQISESGIQLVSSQIIAPTQTVEVFASNHLRYRKYYPFWADGSNVPWNYQSGWIEGAILAGLSRPNESIIQGMLDDFIETESLRQNPSTWNYAGGVFFNGWDDGVSANTPIYVGSGQNNMHAHISYRSMDALALLVANDNGFITFSSVETYLSDLVTHGFLYPLVNSGLHEPASIPFEHARHYARAYLPWHVENQVWALEALVRLEQLRTR